MTKVFLSGANREIGRAEQVAEAGQVIDAFEVAVLLQQGQADAQANQTEKERIQIANTPPSDKSGIGKNGCTMIEYSAKAVAVFGETRAIKDELKAMGGRFNNRLTFNGKRLAGWIFSKSQEQRLAYYFGLD